MCECVHVCECLRVCVCYTMVSFSVLTVEGWVFEFYIEALYDGKSQLVPGSADDGEVLGIDVVVVASCMVAPLYI